MRLELFYDVYMYVLEAFLSAQATSFVVCIYG